MRYFVLTISFLLLACSNTNAQSFDKLAFKKLGVPLKEKTGSYHGKISVSDAKFINNDQHIVFAINETITVCETATGRRLHTLLNRRRSGKEIHRRYDYGWTVRDLHLVDDGQVAMTDLNAFNNGLSTGPDDPGHDSQRWMRWNVSEITSEAVDEPVPTPFFSRDGMSREQWSPIERSLQFIRQIGPDYAFLFNFHSKKPTTIRTYRPGDRIDRPREEIPFDHLADSTIEYVFDRGKETPTFNCVPGAKSRMYENRFKVASHVLLQLARDADGKLTLSAQPIERTNPVGAQVQTTVRRANGAIHSYFGSLDHRIPTRVIDGKLVPLRGIPLHDLSAFAISGHAIISFENGYRSKDPVAVTIVDRQTNKPLMQLPCGSGWMAKPLAFSSDDSKLITVHNLPRPDVRVWTLKEPAAKSYKYPKSTDAKATSE